MLTQKQLILENILFNGFCFSIYRSEVCRSHQKKVFQYSLFDAIEVSRKTADLILNHELHLILSSSVCSSFIKPKLFGFGEYQAGHAQSHKHQHNWRKGTTHCKEPSKYVLLNLGSTFLQPSTPWTSQGYLTSQIQKFLILNIVCIAPCLLSG